MAAIRALWLILALMLAPGLAVAQIGLTTAAPAESSPVLPDPLTPEAADALISRLSDTEVRALLLEQLHTQAEPETADTAGLSEFLYHATTGASTAVTDAIVRLPRLYTGQVEVFQTFYAKMGADGLLRLAGYLVVVFGLALLAELIFRRMTRSWHTLPPAASSEELSLRETFSRLFQRLCHQVLAVVVFVLVARIVGKAILPPDISPVVSLIGPYLIGLPRLAIALGKFFMAPDNPAYRIVQTDDRIARAVVFHQFWFALLIGFSIFIVSFNAMNGLPGGETRLGFWLNLAVHVYLVIVFWRYRDGMVQMMRGGHDDLTPAEERVALAWPYFGIAVSVGMWWIVNIVVSYGNFELLFTSPHYKTMALLLFAPAMDTAIRGLVRHLAPPMTGEGPVAERAYKSSLRSYIRIGRVLVFAFVLIEIAGFWGMSPSGLATAGVGERFAASLLAFLMVLSVGYLAWELVSLVINRKLAAELTAAGYDPHNEEVGGEGGGAGGSRLSTVLPLVLMVARVTIVVVFTLLALGNVGVDTTPLLAGAGIVGLAIGFGAQKLVSDVVSGVFFLVDDAFRVGEYVEVDGTMGTVEKISIRSMQLRHHKGPVHTLPYGEIPKITNYSRDWVIMKLKFTVPFDTDPNKVKKIFKKIGAEMMADPVHKDGFLEPFKSQGVFDIDDVGMVIRGKFMAKPGMQFTIRKEIYNRVKAAFNDAGIDFARREVRVALPDGQGEMSEGDQAALAAAASAAAMQAEAGAASETKG